MPWIIKKIGSQYKIVKKNTGEVVGTSETKEKAEASVRARYASENPLTKWKNKK